MSKELFVSSTPHETKLAVVEEDQVAEVYFERENEYTLAGSIYKGRVTRVLPGMQSAFVDIGLERDAFLYVTDFFEQPEVGDEEGEIEAVPGAQSNGGRQRHQHHEHRQTEPSPAIAEASESPNGQTEAASEQEVSAAPEPGNRQSTNEPREEQRRFGRRRRGRRGRGFPDSKFDRGPRPDAAPRREERSSQPQATYQPIILPGESISKYRNLAASAAPAQVEEQVERAAESHDLPDTYETEKQYEASSEPEMVNEEPAAAPRRPTEEIDVPSILASHQVEEEQHSSSAMSQAFPRDENQTHAPAFGSAGVVEEEEIEEEESDTPGIGSSFEEDEYEDFEEEMLDRVEEMEQHEAAGNTAEAEVSEADQAANEQPSDESQPPELSASERAEEEIEEEDLDEELSEQSAEAHADTDTEVARAEVRGPAGYQQRVAFDRNRQQRGRRGGRRGNVRGRRFHRAPLPQISELLKEGQEVLVQIAKEPIGRKGARITSHIALPGRFLVYMPTVNHNGVSRKIASDEERQRLKRIILSERQSTGDGHQGGFIVRTAAAAASDDDLRADIRFLLNLWSEIQARSESSKSPALIYHDLNLVERTLRDQVSEGFSHIWVDSEQEYERILRFVNRFQASLTKRVKLYTKETPLFEQFGIQDEINKALKSKVWLKSGGYIVINQTEALVAIDVNTGKYVGKTQKLEDTIVKTNVDAIREIVRQIRLRDLGGIIVIDFIDMDERRNRQKVMQALEEALKNDRAPSKVLQFNDFGLVAITRKRVKQSLERTLGSPCTYCTGTGLIKSVSTVCNELYVEMRKMLNHLERGDVIVRVNPEVGKALKANNARWLQDMEELTGKTVIVKSDATLHQEQFDIH